MSVPSKQTIGRTTLVAALGAPFASAGVARAAESVPSEPEIHMVAEPVRRHDDETEDHRERIPVEPSMRAYSEDASSTAESIATATGAPTPRSGGTNPAALAFTVTQMAPDIFAQR
jgi:hypothetical protein